jgi:AraC family transcriptional regulator
MNSLLQFGETKFPNAGLLSCSRGRDWNGLAAELRTHPRGEIPAIRSQQMEITLATRNAPDGWVERRGAGSYQKTAVRHGTLWLCPIGVEEDSIRITAPLPEILHLYISRSQFEHLSEHASRPVTPDEIHYLADVEDELMRQMGYRILRELREESSGGGLLIEQLSLSMLAHLVSSYSARSFGSSETSRRGALDVRRLERVVDYIEANIDGDLALADLAEVACLSRYHFARAFREATGRPPHRYISERRLDHARRHLRENELSLAEISLACRFSSQATFTRAFQRQVGVTPGEFRRRSIS